MIGTTTLSSSNGFVSVISPRNYLGSDSLTHKLVAMCGLDVAAVVVDYF